MHAFVEFNTGSRCWGAALAHLAGAAGGAAGVDLLRLVSRDARASVRTRVRALYPGALLGLLD
jgi:hypothetical protein